MRALILFEVLHVQAKPGTDDGRILAEYISSTGVRLESARAQAVASARKTGDRAQGWRPQMMRESTPMAMTSHAEVVVEPHPSGGHALMPRPTMPTSPSSLSGSSGNELRRFSWGSSGDPMSGKGHNPGASGASDLRGAPRSYQGSGLLRSVFDLVCSVFAIVVVS